MKPTWFFKVAVAMLPWGAFMVGCGGTAPATSSNTIPTVVRPTEAELSGSMAQNEKNQQRFEAMVAQIEPHLKKQPDGTLGLTTGRVVLSTEARQFAEQSLKELNALVREGAVLVGDDLSVQPQGELAAATSRLHNVNAFGMRWYGCDWYLDNNRTEFLSDILTMEIVGSAAEHLKLWAGVRYAKVAQLANAAAIVLPLWGWTIYAVNQAGGNSGVLLRITWITMIICQPQSHL